MLEPEYAEPFAAWQTKPGPETAADMLHLLDPVIRKAAVTYGGAQGSPNIYSKARQLALGALPRYDPSQASLRTFLSAQFRGLQRTTHTEGQAISIPEQVRLDRQHVWEVTERLKDELAREPSTRELADHTGLSMKRLAHIRKAHPGMAEGGMRSRDEEGGEAVYQPGVLDQGQGAAAWAQFIYHSLHPTDQVILEHTIGLHGQPVLPNQQIARKLGITPSAISQRKVRIQQQLDEGGPGGLFA